MAGRGFYAARMKEKGAVLDYVYPTRREVLLTRHKRAAAWMIGVLSILLLVEAVYTAEQIGERIGEERASRQFHARMLDMLAEIDRRVVAGTYLPGEFPDDVLALQPEREP